MLEAVLIWGDTHTSGFWNWEGSVDRDLALDALARVDLAGLQDRSLDSLSGGERRRAADRRRPGAGPTYRDPR